MKPIEELLRQRFGPPHFAFLEQVRAGAGFDQRTADAMAMGLWKSRGLDLHGFENQARQAGPEARAG